ncbi:PhnO protein [Aquimarina sp. EL_43]|uniref:GNAT family N-acetyltransferase n=1 Tax=unclassified Aquimarina TaxID=2627091 RepID=UPI0018CB6FA8|nr:MULTISPECIES: GNAT family N-acetyltransferase [unclassified Aquimarina]MBG6132863.1 PhnO protein [Aquimarina sp. EL_35]MBG6153060.1 PhnO protein [Aquimarina sp. EL_32]MBG6171216.1 PhnO protein [Aquimarina sp. EL_43]
MHKSKIQIRKAKDSDFLSIHHFIEILENQTFEKEKQEQIFFENIKNHHNIYLIAVVENEISGFLSCHVQNLLHHNGLVGEIQEMFVTESCRGLGIGHKLINQLKKIAREKEIIQLEVTSNIKRENAHSFYKNQGFINTHKKFVCKFNE